MSAQRDIEMTDDEIRGSFERLIDRSIEVDADGEVALLPTQLEDAIATGNRLCAERDAAYDLIESLPCYVARGAQTYECRHDAPCPACAARRAVLATREAAVTRCVDKIGGAR